jgi:hypothetical protein
MTATLLEQAERWSRSYNTRRLIEESSRGVGHAMVLGAIVWIASRFSLPVAALTGVAGVGLAGILVMRWRAWRAQAISPAAMAHEIDRHERSGDLLMTGLAIERGEASGDKDFAALVLQRALERAPEVDPTPIRPLAIPYKPAIFGLATLVAASLVHFGADAMLPSIATASEGKGVAEVDRKEGEDFPEVKPEEKDPLLAADVRARLEQDARALDELQKTAGLSEEAKASLARASEELGRAAKKDARSLAALDAMTRAEREMRKVEEQSKKGEHLDREKFEKMSSKELADQMKQASEKADADAMAQAASALAKRMEQGGAGLSKEDRERLARLMREQADRKDASGSKGEKKEGERGLKRLSRESERESSESSSSSASSRESESMRRLAKLLREGDREGARRELERMAKESRRDAGSKSGKESFSHRLGETRKSTSSARRSTIARLGGESKTCDDPGSCGSASRAGREGEGREGSKMGSGEGREGGKGGEGQSGREGSSSSAQAGRRPGGAGNSSSMSSDGQQGITRKGGSAPAPGGGHAGNKGGKSARGDAGGGSEWISSQWKEGGESIVKAIERVNRGEDSVVGYREIHNSYESIAESATEQEEIPLTRRGYIRDYFEAIRPAEP